MKLSFIQKITRYRNKFIIFGLLSWLLGIAYALSLGFEVLIVVALMELGNYLYDLGDPNRKEEEN